jgi:hypothetical protein
MRFIRRRKMRQKEDAVGKKSRIMRLVRRRLDN